LLVKPSSVFNAVMSIGIGDVVLIYIYDSLSVWIMFNRPQVNIADVLKFYQSHQYFLI